MGTELIIPEILLVEKLEETDNSFAPALWEGLRNEIVIANEEESKLPAPVRNKKRMLLSDFVNKAISLPLEITPQISKEAEKQLYRLHLFCCQQSIHNPEVRHNPLVLGFHALNEMKLALVGIMISYRLINPDCPYNWNRTFFEQHILTHKGPDGHTIVNFNRIDPQTFNAAITEEIVTDWLIYRGYGHNGIRTLMDVKNHLQTLPNYKRGGHPADEFSRFERKMREQFNRKELRKEETLDLEFRKTLVKTVAEQTAAQLINSGMSIQDILATAFSADLSKLTSSTTISTPKPTPLKENKKALPKPKDNTDYIEGIISHLLED
ncbi:MAG: hypothetical protein NC218_06925 [Acetobacter sp.]|nr:hypothetical protein [Acetobacter sp.]